MKKQTNNNNDLDSMSFLDWLFSSLIGLLLGAILGSWLITFLSPN